MGFNFKFLLDSESGLHVADSDVTDSEAPAAHDVDSDDAAAAPLVTGGPLSGNLGW